ncbi:MAG: transglycosylase SLT domain-containing protein [Proteobacteria bacterium]|nr:transglycosylase SLT domain-containing protein [Pseudomonadota bacterium]
MKKTALSVLLTAFFLAGTALPAKADKLDPRISRDAWRVITKVEYREGIPRGLLHSMSLVETGMAQEGKVMPWPYTANVNQTERRTFAKREDALEAIDHLRRLGFTDFEVTADNLERKYITAHAAERFLNGIEADSYSIAGHTFTRRFGDKAEAVQFVQELIDQGYTNVDIGLMQVNWKYHGENFTSVDEAFDPYKNVDYAVSYLRKHRQTRDWWGSVGLYHSGTKAFADKYVKSVWGMYQKVLKLPASTI